MDDKDKTLQDLKQDCAKWRGRAIEAAEMACQLCRAADPEMCRHCRVEKIRKEAITRSGGDYPWAGGF